MSKTVVVNRANQHDVYIGRPSLFGNPFPINDTQGRRAVIEKYREYFHKKIEGDPSFKKEVLQLRGKRLGCYCSPLRCHGDVIAEYLNDLFPE